MKYRQDVAGLRAVAVLPILLFHAGITAIPGGFVGVDIFFIISGFLITSIIAHELETGKFSMLEFYRRRVARIVPALILVLGATLIAGVVLMLPPELEELGPSTASASFFGSNFYFLFTTDYFDAVAETKPLLHTWSLAVEEQFYIFYPVLFLIIWRWRSSAVKISIIAACLLSFICALFLGYRKPEAAFYMIPARAWELGVGALIALGAFPKLESYRNLRNALATIGLVAIIFAIFYIEPGKFFPAPLALIPCLGAAMLIAYGAEAPTSKFLAARPMQWIGNISYSLYLWHWPIITFWRLETGMHLSLAETFLLVSVSFIAAFATYKLVEQPWIEKLRRGKEDHKGIQSAPKPGRVVLAGLGLQLAACAVAMGAPQLANKFRAWPEDVLHVLAFTKANYTKTVDYEMQYRRGTCFYVNNSKNYNWDCLAADNTKSNLIIFGDSHAAQYWLPFSERFPDWHVIQATNSGCRPVLRATGDKLCTDVVQFVFNDLAKREKGVEAVVLAGRWKDYELEQMRETIRELKGRGLRVMVIGPTVEYEVDFPLIVARAMLSKDLASIEKYRLPDRKALDKSLGDLVRTEGAIYVSVYDLECPEKECSLIDSSGAPYHFDYGHLTLSAARELVSKMPAP